ncbi:hypothetical protein [Clostridium sp.]|uniref:hypothetical protein n=1 Tax=Clostridium sp. TaxID=1506 RepID=UPI003F350916
MSKKRRDEGKSKKESKGHSILYSDLDSCTTDVVGYTCEDVYPKDKCTGVLCDEINYNCNYEGFTNVTCVNTGEVTCTNTGEVTCVGTGERLEAITSESGPIIFDEAVALDQLIQAQVLNKLINDNNISDNQKLVLQQILNKTTGKYETEIKGKFDDKVYKSDKEKYEKLKLSKSNVYTGEPGIDGVFKGHTGTYPIDVTGATGICPLGYTGPCPISHIGPCPTGCTGCFNVPQNCQGTGGNRLNQSFTKVTALASVLDNAQTNISSLLVAGEDEKFFYDRKVRPIIDVLFFLTQAAQGAAITAQNMQANAYAKKKQIRLPIDLAYEIIKESYCVFETFKRRNAIYRRIIEMDIKNSGCLDENYYKSSFCDLDKEYYDELYHCYNKVYYDGD